MTRSDVAGITHCGWHAATLAARHQVGADDNGCPEENSRMTRTLTITTLAVALLAAPAREARADVLLTPFLGVTFGGDTSEQQVNYGLSAAFLGAGIFGLEIDASLTPEFFGSDREGIDDSNVTTVMANLVLSAPTESPVIRPYVAAGFGLIRAKATSVGNVFDFDDNSFGVNIGGGVVAQASDRIGIRGDLRYFRRVQDASDDEDFDLDLAGFNFWRATLGVSFRF
jgi:opacity protein-like surface antigen